MNKGIFPSQEPATQLRFRRQVFTSSGNWNRPANVRDVQVEICGGGGNGNTTNNPCTGNTYYEGGKGGNVNALVTNVPSRVTVTVGAGPGGTSSFGSMITCTGGSNAGLGNGSNGSATIANNVTSNGSVSWFLSAAWGSAGQNYGSSGLGSAVSGGTGAQGVVIVSWMEPVL